MTGSRTTVSLGVFCGFPYYLEVPVNVKTSYVAQYNTRCCCITQVPIIPSRCHNRRPQIALHSIRICSSITFFLLQNRQIAVSALPMIFKSYLSRHCPVERPTRILRSSLLRYRYFKVSLLPGEMNHSDCLKPAAFSQCWDFFSFSHAHSIFLKQFLFKLQNGLDPKKGASSPAFASWSSSSLPLIPTCSGTHINQT